MALSIHTDDERSAKGIVLDDCVTAQTAAALTGYNIQHVRRLAYRGKLEAVRVGRAWLIKLDSLQRYLRQARRMGDSKQAILRQGGWPFNAPDGYLNKREAVANGKFRTWIEKDPPRFQMWREAYDLLLTDRYTLAEICMELHNRGYVRSTGKPWMTTTKTGQHQFHDNKLSRGLRRPFYAGRAVSRHYGVCYEDGIQGQWEPIVTVEEYERAMEILHQRDNYKVRQKRYIYLMRDLLSINVDGQVYKMFSSSPTGRSRTYSYYMTRAKVNGSKIHIPCEVIDHQIPDWLADIQIPQALVPRMRALYQQHVAQLNGPDRDEQVTRLAEQIRQLRAEEADLGRLLLHKQIGQEAYDQLRHEWQQKLSHKQQELEALQRETSVYIDDLDAAIMLLSRASVLFERLAKHERARLLKLLLKQVVVDCKGTVIGVRLNAPFAYLSDLARIAEDTRVSQGAVAVADGPENSVEVLSFANRASVGELQALVGDPE